MQALAPHSSFPCSAWECRPGRSAASGQAGRRRGASQTAFPSRAWERGRHAFARLIATVGIALLAPAFVVAQVEKAEPRLSFPTIEAPKVPPPVVDPLGAARREAEAKKRQEAVLAKGRGVAAEQPSTNVVEFRALIARRMDLMFRVLKGRYEQSETQIKVHQDGQNAQDALFEAQKKEFVPRYLTELRPFLIAEYRFLRAVCAPSKEQRRPIARAGLVALKEAATTHVERKWRPAWRIPLSGQPAANPYPRPIILGALEAAAKQHLTSEQWERYRYELEDREMERRRITILNLVAQLDQQLILSPRQRDAISESLSARWNDSWWQGIQMYSLESQYFPPLPDDGVVSLLNENQRKIWTGLNTMTFNAYGIGGMAPDNSPLDDEFPDEPQSEQPIAGLGPKPKPEAKE
jgi:hypothetical protein